MTEQKKTIFTNLRDKHGVADLLREVSARKSALTPKHRREVNNIVDRMEGSSSHTSSETVDQNLSDHSDSSSLDDSYRPVGPMNNWGNNFLQKFNRPAPQNPLKANNPPQFFRKFSIQRNQNEQEREGDPSNSGEKTNDRREEILKSLERSQQQGKEILQRKQEQGREMLQKFSSNFQTFSNNVRTSSKFQDFSNNVRTSLKIQTNADKAAEIEQTLKELEKKSAHSTKRRTLNMNSSHSRSSMGKASNHSMSSFDGDII